MAIQSLHSAHSDFEHGFENCSQVEPVIMIRRNDKHCFSDSASVPSNSQASKDEKVKKAWFRLEVNVHSGIQQRYPQFLGSLKDHNGNGNVANQKV